MSKAVIPMGIDRCFSILRVCRRPSTASEIAEKLDVSSIMSVRRYIDILCGMDLLAVCDWKRASRKSRYVRWCYVYVSKCIISHNNRYEIDVREEPHGYS